MKKIRTLLFYTAFYLNALVQFLIYAIPSLFVSERLFYKLAIFWCRSSIFLHRIFIGTRLEIRGQEHIPKGAFIIACKHQSSFETIALLPFFSKACFIFKSSLLSLPLFGKYLRAIGSVPIERGKGGLALKSMSEGVGKALQNGHQIIIFPEGTRRPLDADPIYKYGIQHLYEKFDVPVLPIAINAGAFWPKGSFNHHSGNVVLEILPPIPPGLAGDKFKDKLVQTIENKSLKLLEEAAQDKSPIAIEALESLKLRSS